MRSVRLSYHGDSKLLRSQIGDKELPDFQLQNMNGIRSFSELISDLDNHSIPLIISGTEINMAIITLMTDFGIKDGNVGVMKGVIWNICPQAQIADLSHMVGAQNIREAALVLARSAPYFPKDTVHVVVVDPGVGTKRRPMAARIGDWYYVGPGQWDHYSSARACKAGTMDL